MSDLQKPQILKPFTRFCMTIGNLPSSYLVSLTYEEQLLWLCDYIKNTVIPTVNNNAEALEEVQNLYLQLKEYVDNYFTNLNVQEQIDNKLDEMAQSGELQEIMNLYISNTVIRKNTVQDMKKNSENLVNGSTVRTLGFYTINDNGSALYRITNENLIANEHSIISLSNGLYAVLIPENNVITDKQIGLQEKTNISDILNSILNDDNYNCTIKFTKNSIYYALSTINIDLWKNSIDGNSCFIISKISDINNYVFNIGTSYNNNDNTGDLLTSFDGSPYENFSNCFFKNITIQYFKDENNTYLYQTNAIKFNNDIGKCAHLTFERITIVGFRNGITICSNFYMNNFIGLLITNCTNGIYCPENLEDTGEKITFKNGMISSCDYAIYCNGTYELIFENMSIDYNYKIGYLNGSRIFFTNCHIENPQRTTRQYRNSVQRTGLETSQFDIFGNYTNLNFVNCVLAMALQKSGDENIIFDYVCNVENYTTIINLISNWGEIKYEYIANKGLVTNVGFRTRSTILPTFKNPNQQIYPDVNCTNENMLFQTDRESVSETGGFKCTKITGDGKQQNLFKLPRIDNYFKLTVLIEGDITKYNPRILLYQTANENDDFSKFELLYQNYQVSTVNINDSIYTKIIAKPDLSYIPLTDSEGVHGMYGEIFNKNKVFFMNVNLRVAGWDNFIIKKITIDEL